MLDANFNYLNRVDFREVARHIWKEEKAHKKDVSFATWKKQMIELIRRFDYHTAAARKLRDADKETQIRIIRNLSET